MLNPDAVDVDLDTTDDRVVVTFTGRADQVGVAIRATAMSGWPLPNDIPDDLLPQAGFVGAVPLAAQVARMGLTFREVGSPPPGRVRWLLRELAHEIAALAHPCPCGSDRWTFCRSRSGANTSAHAVRRVVPPPEPATPRTGSS